MSGVSPCGVQYYNIVLDDVLPTVCRTKVLMCESAGWSRYEVKVVRCAYTDTGKMDPLWCILYVRSSPKL